MPPSHPLFGAYLYRLLVINLYASEPKSPELEGSLVERCVDYLRKAVPATRAYRSDIWKWINGYVEYQVQGRENKKGLSVPKLKQIVTAFAGKPGLKTLDQLRFWLSLGPERYRRVLLYDPEILGLHWISSSSDAETCVTFRDDYIERTEVLQRILSTYDKMRRSFVMPAALGIWGVAGRGKTTLCEVVQCFPLLVSKGESIIYADDTEEEDVKTFLHALWPDERNNPFPGEERDLEVIQRQLRKLHQEKPTTYIFCGSIKHWAHLDALISTLTPECFVVFTTEAPDVASLAHTCIKVPPLTEDETLRLASRVLRRPLEPDEKDTSPPLTSDDKQMILKIAELQLHTPLGVLFALHLARSGAYTLSEVMRQCRITPGGEDVPVRESLLTVFRLNYELLPQSLQQSSVLLGAMRHFRSFTDQSLAALWQVSIEEVHQRAGNIRAYTRFLKPVGDDAWSMHEQVWLYIQTLYRNLPSEVRANAEKWLEREQKSPSMQLLIDKVARSFSLRDTLAYQKKYREFHASPRLGRRFLRHIFHLGYYTGPEWDMLQKIPNVLSSTEYALAVLAGRRERKWMKPLVMVLRCSGIVLLVIIAGILGLLASRGEAAVEGLFMVAVLALLAWMLGHLVEIVQNEKIWMYLWTYGVKKKSDEP